MAMAETEENKKIQCRELEKNTGVGIKRIKIVRLPW